MSIYPPLFQFLRGFVPFIEFHGRGGGYNGNIWAYNAHLTDLKATLNRYPKADGA